MKSIAIDGPAGAGKSTVAKQVAKHLGYIYVDTGALYRSIGLFALEQGLDPTDEQALVSRLDEVKVELRYQQEEQRVILNGEDVSEKIRTPQMSEAASKVSAMPAVRQFLFDMQRQMASQYNLIMDGRDIGTVVLPNADVKLFLTATPEARAKRRYEEYLAKGQAVSYNDILEDMKQRDYSDSHRAISPLKQAEDAILLDTSGNTVEQSVELVLKTLAKRGIQ